MSPSLEPKFFFYFGESVPGKNNNETSLFGRKIARNHNYLTFTFPLAIEKRMRARVCKYWMCFFLFDATQQTILLFGSVVSNLISSM